MSGKDRQGKKEERVKERKRREERESTEEDKGQCQPAKIVQVGLGLF